MLSKRFPYLKKNDHVGFGRSLQTLMQDTTPPGINSAREYLASQTGLNADALSSYANGRFVNNNGNMNSERFICLVKYFWGIPGGLSDAEDVEAWAWAAGREYVASLSEDWFQNLVGDKQVTPNIATPQATKPTPNAQRKSHPQEAAAKHPSPLSTVEATHPPTRQRASRAWIAIVAVIVFALIIGVVNWQRGLLLLGLATPEASQSVPSAATGASAAQAGNTPEITDIPGADSSPATATINPPTLQPSSTSVSAATQPVIPTLTAPPPLPEAINLSSSAGDSIHTTLAFDPQGTLHVFWLDNTNPESGLIHRQMPTGGEWSSAEILTTGFGMLIGMPKIVSEPGGKLCIFWNDSGASVASAGIYQQCWVNGETGPAVLVDNSMVISRFSPAFQMDGGLAIIEQESEGLKFNGAVLTDHLGFHSDPALAIDPDGTYHLAWERIQMSGTDATLQYIFSTDSGQTWSEPAILSSLDNKQGTARSIYLLAGQTGDLHLVWSTALGVSYRHWTATGGWESVIEFSVGSEATPAGAAAAVLDANGLVHILWQHSNLYYIHQLPEGGWSTPQIVAEVGPAFMAYPALAVDSQGQAHIAWRGIDQDIHFTILP